MASTPKITTIFAALRTLLLDNSQNPPSGPAIVPGLMDVIENIPFDLMVTMPCANLVVNIEEFPQPENVVATVTIEIHYVSGDGKTRSSELRDICHAIRQVLNIAPQIGPSQAHLITGIRYRPPGTRLADGALILTADIQLKIFYKEDWHG